MSTALYPALAPYGWTERVRALWAELDEPTLRPGRVVRVDRAAAMVVRADGTERSMPSRDPLAVGDWVALDGDSVSRVLARWSAMTRMHPAQSGAHAGAQVLAANVDVVVITAPADRLRVSRVERELALAWDSGARPVVALTKGDLDAGGALESLRARVVGVEILETSARSGVGLDELRAEIAPGCTAVLLGPSGAGKSTLLNALLGEEAQATGDVRAGDSRGRHTTTTRQLRCVPGGGVLIDTPGLRSLALALADDGSLDDVFPEIDTLAQGCRFSDCRHETEPGCAVKDAVSDGTLDLARLASFKKLTREVEAGRRRVDPVARREALRVWKLRAKDVRRHDKRRPEG